MDPITPPPSVQKTNDYLIPLSILLSGLLIAGAIIFTHFAGSTQLAPIADNTKGAQAPAALTVNVKDVKIAGSPFMGESNAPVTLVIWEDFQCPFCKQFESKTLPLIVEKYVKPGKVKVVFKDFAFLGPDSETAALFARGVWELYPGSYVAWRTAMFTAQDEEGGGFGNEASILALAKTVSGIDATKVAALVAKKKADYLKSINGDRDEGATFGIQGTPGFVTGTQSLSGSLPYANFAQALDGQLK